MCPSSGGQSNPSDNTCIPRRGSQYLGIYHSSIHFPGYYLLSPGSDGYLLFVESVAQVVGRRTQDHKVLSSSPDSGLISKVAVKLRNRFYMSHRWPSVNGELGGNCDLTETCVLVTATGTAIIQKAQYVRVGPFPMISGVIVKSGENFRLDPDYKPAALPFI